MTKDASESRLDSISVERRRLPRKRVLLNGVVADANGKNETDCTIRDLTARGAQVQLSKKLQRHADVYLVDTFNEVAHLATVAWVEGSGVGLSFVRSYSLESTLPPPLEFLARLLVEAKLRQVQGLIRRNVPVEEALRVIGLSEEYLERFGMHNVLEDRVGLLLHQAKQLFQNKAEGL